LFNLKQRYILKHHYENAPVTLGWGDEHEILTNGT